MKSDIDYSVEEWDSLDSLKEEIENKKQEGKSIRVVFSQNDQLRDEVKVHEKYQWATEFDSSENLWVSHFTV